MRAYSILTHEHCYYISTPPIHDVTKDGVVKFNEHVINLQDLGLENLALEL